MVAPVVFHDLTTISLCDALTGWTAVGGTNTLNDPLVFDQIQGDNCIQNYTAATANRGADYDFGAGNEKDFSSTCIYFWFAFSKKAYHATNPIRIRVTDSAGNWREWNIFTKDTLPHPAWIAWALHTAIAYDDQSATAPTMTAIRKVGWRADSVVGKVYIYFDAWRYGTTIGIKRGTSTPTDEATLEKIWTAEDDSANKYGVLGKSEGVFFLQGKLMIGSTTSGEDTYFLDKSQVVVFKNAKVPSDFYSIKFQGNSGADTKIYFGEKIGGKGVSGLFIKAANLDKRFAVEATDTTRMFWGLYATTFFQARRIEFPIYSANRECISCNFEECWEVYPSTTALTYCNFIAPSGETPARACRISSIPNPPKDLNITNCNFISCYRAVNITVDGTETINFNALKFSGNDKDIEKSSPTGDLTIENTNDSDAGTYIITGGGSVTIVTAITLTIRHVKTGNEPTEYVQCSIHKKEDMTEIMNMEATVADEQNLTYYKASMSYTQAGFVVIVRAREKGWLPFEIELTIPSGGLDVTAVWLPDPNYEA